MIPIPIFVHKLFLFVVLVCSLQIVQIFGQSTWDGLMPQKTTTGLPCLTLCEKRGENYFWCYLTESSGNSEHPGWGYCSPTQRSTYHGQQCTKDCTKYQSYYWCPTDSHGLVGNYCGPTPDSYNNPVVAQHFTTTGEFCVSPCDYVGETYSWCYKAGGSWGNCSITPGYDINGAECKNTCDYRKYPYSWCYLKKGSWNYCGQSTVSSMTQYTYLGSKCLSPCVLDANSSTNKCYDASKRKRECSRVPGLSTDNMKCLTKCDTNQVASMKSWYSCRTAADLWSRCSKFETDPNFYHVHRRIPGGREYFPVGRIDMALLHTSNRENVYEIIDEQGPRSVSVFEAVPRTGLNALHESRRYHVNAAECLRDWRRQSFQVPPGRNTMRLALGGTERTGVRLDLQSRYVSPLGVPYLNLQMQINGITRVQNRGQSTSIAEAQVPEELVRRFPGRVVDALYRSMNERYAVHVGCFNYTEQDQPGPSNRVRGRGAGELLMVAIKETDNENGMADEVKLTEENDWNLLEDEGGIKSLLSDTHNEQDVFSENYGFTENYNENVRNSGENRQHNFGDNNIESDSTTRENEIVDGTNTDFVTPDEPRVQWKSFGENNINFKWLNGVGEGNSENYMGNEMGRDTNKANEIDGNHNIFNTDFAESFNEDSEPHLNMNFDFKLNDDSIGVSKSFGNEDVELNELVDRNMLSTHTATWDNDDTGIDEDLATFINNGFEDVAW